MRRETGTNNDTDSSQSVGTGSKPKSKLKWHRMKINPQLVSDLQKYGRIFTAAVNKDIKRITKQVYDVKRVMNG